MSPAFIKFPGDFWLNGFARRARPLASASIYPLVCLLASYIYTCAHGNGLGIFYLPLATAAADTGMSLAGARKALKVCIDLGFCVYDHKNFIILICGKAVFQYGDKPLHKNHSQRRWLLEEWESLPPSPLTDAFKAHYAPIWNIPENRGAARPDASHAAGKSGTPQASGSGPDHAAASAMPSAPGFASRQQAAPVANSPAMQRAPKILPDMGATDPRPAAQGSPKNVSKAQAGEMPAQGKAPAKAAPDKNPTDGKMAPGDAPFSKKDGQAGKISNGGGDYAESGFSENPAFAGESRNAAKACPEDKDDQAGANVQTGPASGLPGARLSDCSPIAKNPDNGTQEPAMARAAGQEGYTAHEGQAAKAGAKGHAGHMAQMAEGDLQETDCRDAGPLATEVVQGRGRSGARSSRYPAGWLKLELIELEFADLREFYSQHGRREGIKAGFIEFRQARLSAEWPGLDLIKKDIASRQWRKGFEPGLGRYLRDRVWTDGSCAEQPKTVSKARASPKPAPKAATVTEFNSGRTPWMGRIAYLAFRGDAWAKRKMNELKTGGA